MKTLVVGTIVFWNGLLYRLGRVFGLFFGGLTIGWHRGQKDIIDGQKYLKYKQQMLRKQIEKEMEDN